MASLASCGDSLDELLSADPPPPALPELGRVGDFASGITELDLPRRVFVVVDGNQVSAFDRKDPNNGCALSVVDEEARVSFELTNEDAQFFEQCHGNTYDIAGRPLHCAEALSMRSVDVRMEDGNVLWAGIAVDPNEPEPLSRPDCPAGIEH